MLELSAIGLATAFGAGLISFLSPCVLPLVPGYVSYVAGSSLDELRSDESSARVRALGYASCFVAGFSVVFIALGASATALGSLLLAWRYELGIVAGLVIILFGIHMLGLSPFSMMQREARFHLDVPGGKPVGAFLIGVAFAFGWTPCIGPVLGAILTMSAGTADLAKGTLLLTAYAFGLGVPFLLAAAFTGRLLQQMRNLSRMGRRLQQGSGALLVAMGLLMVTGQLEILAYWLLETFPALATIG